MKADQQTTRSIIVKGSASELYHLWADLESFPRFISGQVVFTEMPHGETQVTVNLMVVPQGKIGGAAAGLFGNLDETLEADLRSFKAYAEARQPAAVARG